MKSSKIITIIVSFLLGVITAMAYQESKNEENKNPLQQAVEQAQGTNIKEWMRVKVVK